MARILQDLLKESKAQGWAVGQASMAQVRLDAAMLKWTEVPTRRGGPALSTLRPVDQAEAEPNSLSSRYGKGAQPLHTDGAHLLNPPDIVVLACETTSTTPTRLWNGMLRGPYVEGVGQPVQHGVFLISSGNDSFFDVAYTRRRLRFDPGCMLPCDARARRAAQYFEEALGSAIDHRWTEPSQVLLIDNRRVLHARSSAIDEPQREIQRVSFHLNREGS
ncbi:TauD/TfdA family dioxygenase [Streptomyces sp. NPDC048257]|uniref:TauD/TfdA family dioxygenase n=1 Tax=Streptomyces sp. NPDC048257 TaxID=3365526 RepID=UPI003712E23B